MQNLNTAYMLYLEQNQITKPQNQKSQNEIYIDQWSKTEERKLRSTYSQRKVYWLISKINNNNNNNM